MGTDPTGMFDDWTCEYGGCYPTITVTTSVCLSCYVEYFSVMMDMSGPVNGLMPDPVLPAAPWCNPYFLSGCGTGGVNYFPPTLPNNCQFVLANPCGSSGSTPPTVKGKQPQSPPSSPNACEQQNLNAVNNQFGTGFTTSNVEGMFQYSTGAPAGTGTLNLDISVAPQYQSNGISPGRYPVNWWSYIIGYGPTLHIPAGPGGLDSGQTLVFSNSQFTEHLDSAFPYNPFGFLIHLFEDVFGVGGRRQCP
jgi:hypothetical protein